MPLAGFPSELAFKTNIFLQHWILLLNAYLFFALIVVCAWMEQTERMQGSKMLRAGQLGLQLCTSTECMLRDVLPAMCALQALEWEWRHEGSWPPSATRVFMSTWSQASRFTPVCLSFSFSVEAVIVPSFAGLARISFIMAVKCSLSREMSSMQV